jgi:hypothetical protein
MVTIRVPADPNEPVETTYGEESEAAMACFGRVTHERACYVEPGDPEKGQDPSKWYVDSSPLGGEWAKVLGPFTTRALALGEEALLLKKYFKRPK